MKFFLLFFNFIIIIKNENVNYIFSAKTKEKNSKLFLILTESGKDKKYEMNKLDLKHISLKYNEYYFYSYSLELNINNFY